MKSLIRCAIYRYHLAVEADFLKKNTFVTVENASESDFDNALSVIYTAIVSKRLNVCAFKLPYQVLPLLLFLTEKYLLKILSFFRQSLVLQIPMGFQKFWKEKILVRGHFY